ncbi:hypothetical protein LSTR_LSTR000893 [Laodelphax striatellus]|uniref:PHD-type domain-containing protein n=1 Tax=Laodelphax striatellus TaxID=195883 RepID=A0A482X162_LAOST|nr:hypothetical protein LSTR_LSTR000893 [Laodelphax striatellus]
MSCKICFKSVRSGQNKVACGVCSALVHTTCAGLNTNDVKIMTENNRIWRCTDCNLERSKSMSDVTPVSNDSSLSLVDVISLLKGMREDQKKMEIDLGNSLEACHADLFIYEKNDKELGGEKVQCQENRENS